MIVRVQEVRKSYGARVVLDGVSMEVREGEVFGLLGPNGAGKTTLISILEGLRRPDAGTATVLDRNPFTFGRHERSQIGAQLDQAGLPAYLTALEVLEFFARISTAGDPQRLLASVGLSDAARTQTRHLSTGQRQRLAVAAALIGEPRLVFLDEPTLGMDPIGRRAIWQLVEQERRRGTTFVLTTNSMEEAEHLCDRVALLFVGRVLALGSPRALAAECNQVHRFEVESEGAIAPPDCRGIVRSEDSGGSRWVLFSNEPARTLEDLIRWRSAASNGTARSFALLRPSLEDVFMQMATSQERER